MPELDQQFEDKFISKDKFAEEIEKIVLKYPEMTYIDAIVEYCEQNSMEIEAASKLVNKTLKDKLKKDATELNYLRATTKAKLDFK